MTYRDDGTRYLWVRLDRPGTAWEMARLTGQTMTIAGRATPTNGYVFGAQIPSHAELQEFYAAQARKFAEIAMLTADYTLEGDAELRAGVLWPADGSPPICTNGYRVHVTGKLTACE